MIIQFIMKGLYILESSHLKLNKTLKIGMSEKLENRWSHYKPFIPDAHYLYCYELLDNLTKKDILYLESLVLNETKESRNTGLATEYRIIDCDELHQIIIKYLNYYNVEYKIHEKPIFKTCKNNISDEFVSDYPDNYFADILAKPPKRFREIKQINVKNMLELQEFINIEFVTDKCILANKNNNLYIIKKRDVKIQQEKSYNIFTPTNNISNHYKKMMDLIKDKKYDTIKYCYLIVYLDDYNDYIYYLIELTSLNTKYTIENIAKGDCDEMITILTKNIKKYKIT